MNGRRTITVAAILTLGGIAYLVAPKHPPQIVERTVGGFTRIDSGWSRLVGPAAVIDWRVQVNGNPAKPPFVLFLRRRAGDPWPPHKSTIALLCDGRRIDLDSRRVDLNEGESVRYSFVVGTGPLAALEALAAAAGPQLLIDETPATFGSEGPPTFRLLASKAARP